MMINSNELRIGNLFRTTGGVKIVTGIMVDGESTNIFWGKDDDSKYIDSRMARPIPLTAEWLERFGFVESNSYNDKEKHFKKDEFTQLADYGAQIIILPEGGFAYLSCGYYENQIDCPYVHRLQNLYFALTGEELTIKETV